MLKNTSYILTLKHLSLFVRCQFPGCLVVFVLPNHVTITDGSTMCKVELRPDVLSVSEKPHVVGFLMKSCLLKNHPCGQC